MWKFCPAQAGRALSIIHTPTRLSLLCGKQFPVSSRKFPDQVRREFRRNQLTYSRKTEVSPRVPVENLIR